MTTEEGYLFSKNWDIIYNINHFIIDVRRHNIALAAYRTTTIISMLIQYVSILSENSQTLQYNGIKLDFNEISSMCGQLLDAQKKLDYILLADYFEVNWVPFLIKLQEAILVDESVNFYKEVKDKNLTLLRKNDLNLAEAIDGVSPQNLIDAGYNMEYSSTGWSVLSNKCSGRVHYYHSNYMPEKEAYQLALEWRSDSCTEYAIFGFALGYHIIELLWLEPFAKITVYENDRNILAAAMFYQELSLLLKSENITIIYDPTLHRWWEKVKAADESTAVRIYHPSIMNIKDPDKRSEMEEYFVRQNGIRNQLRFLNSNFKENVKHYDLPADSLKKEFYGKDLYIAAAGPSLDNNFMQLKKIGQNGILLCLGTVFKKLAAAGIIPDYVMFTDPKPETYKQLEGMEDREIPLIGLSTVNQMIIRNYSGRKYLMFQEGYGPAEEYAADKGLMLVSTGGSVATTAVDLGIRMGCRRIICVGMDLAFPDNRGHASDTSHGEETLGNMENLLVEDVHGNMVPTVKTFNMYRKWIEDRIRTADGIEFIDATEGGARIAGMKIKKLSDCL